MTNNVDAVGNGTVKNEKIVKTRNAPRTDIAEPGIPKASLPAQAGIAGKRFERLVGRFDDARCGIGIILGDEMPNAP